MTGEGSNSGELKNLSPYKHLKFDGGQTYRVRSNWTCCEQGVGQEDLPPTPSKSVIQFAMQITGKASTSISWQRFSQA